MTGRGKLVRDRIPDLIRASGQVPVTSVARSDLEYARRLDEKLREEVREYLYSGDLAELADISEVVRAIARARGSSPDEVERMRVAKREERGGFDGRVVWLGNTHVAEEPER